MPKQWMDLPAEQSRMPTLRVLQSYAKASRLDAAGSELLLLLPQIHEARPMPHASRTRGSDKPRGGYRRKS